MIRIECDPWEQKQLSEYLQYSRKKLCEDYNKKEITLLYLKIELEKIDNLLNVVSGKCHHDYLLDAKTYRQRYDVNRDLTEAEKEIRRLPEV